MGAGAAGADPSAASATGTIVCCVESSSIVQQALTERVGWTVVVAVLVLVVLGRTKPVRGKRPLLRRGWEKLPGVRPRVAPRLEIQYQPTALYRRPGVVRRGVSLVGSGVISVVLGAVLALVVGASAVWAVTSLTGRLR
jgi:hypothetical protein